MKKLEVSFNEQAVTVQEGLGMTPEQGEEAINKIAELQISLGEEDFDTPTKVIKHLIKNFSQNEVLMLAYGSMIRIHENERLNNPLTRLAHLMGEEAED